ncbi:uncharacterized protein LOC125633506 isoform X1 [Caretta caretta]|uniref:uncharacterized protein LOC125633506 isoform X1 n=1 Tax=Caretta caretta TaxID=8467 RepID=UPI002094CD13|nr:uncharacterized protein LOC125633506 isoform X1 [Caretta caretta]
MLALPARRPRGLRSLFWGLREAALPTLQVFGGLLQSAALRAALGLVSRSRRKEEMQTTSRRKGECFQIWNTNKIWDFAYSTVETFILKGGIIYFDVFTMYAQNLAKRRRHEDDCEEDMDTDVPESTGCGNWDITVAVGLVDTVERLFWAWQTSTDWWDRIALQNSAEFPRMGHRVAQLALSISDPAKDISWEAREGVYQLYQLLLHQRGLRKVLLGEAEKILPPDGSAGHPQPPVSQAGLLLTYSLLGEAQQLMEDKQEDFTANVMRQLRIIRHLRQVPEALQGCASEATRNSRSLLQEGALRRCLRTWTPESVSGRRLQPLGHEENFR